MEGRAENFLKGNSRKQSFILLPATLPVDLLFVNLKHICLRPQRLHVLLQLVGQIICQENDVTLPSLIKLRLWKRPVINYFG